MSEESRIDCGGEDVKTWTQAELDELILCPKQVIDPPRKEMRSERGHQRNDMTLGSLNGEWRFSAFMRINERFPENFSVGLIYDPRDEPGDLTLLRCNGPHGEHDNSPMDDPQPHFGYHIHRARADVINAGLLPQKFAELTDAYASFPEAVRHFLKLANIVGAEAYFPMVDQLPSSPSRKFDWDEERAPVTDAPIANNPRTRYINLDLDDEERAPVTDAPIANTRFFDFDLE